MTYPVAATRWAYCPAHDVRQVSDIFEGTFRQVASRCDVLTGGGDLPYGWATALLIESVRGD